MGQLIEALKNMKGENVDIHTRHKLFGNQHIQMNFVPETEIGFGFHCNGQSIYIKKNDVVDCCIEKCKVIIIGNDFEIEITKMA